VCLSFISPEEVIKRKDSFMFERFLKFFSGELKEFFENLSLKYKDEIDVIRGIQERYPYLFKGDAITDEYNYYVSKNSQELESEYHELNNFQTTIRGIKVRGTFETLREAEVRAQVLKKLDDRFHVYVAEVGCWCPWSPNPDDITNQEYGETQLNTLMKGYKDNQEKKDTFYHERKRDLQKLRGNNKVTVEDAMSDALNETNISDGPETVPVDINPQDAVDPWMQRKDTAPSSSGSSE
jgi:hypothetical protein